MKAVEIIAIILVILILAGVWIWSKIVFTLGFKGIDLSSFDINSLLGTGQTESKLLLNVNIKNGSPVSIPFNKMQASLYYDNTLIAESSGNLYAQSFNLPAYGSKDISDYVNVHINPASIDLIKSAVLKQNPNVNYTVKVNVFGIPLTYSSSFNASV